MCVMVLFIYGPGAAAPFGWGRTPRMMSRPAFPEPGAAGAVERFSGMDGCAAVVRGGAVPMRNPCDRCRLVADPGTCQDMECPRWRQWWLDRWEQTRILWGAEPALAPDPCESCVVPKAFCAVPCAARRAWRGEGCQ